MSPSPLDALAAELGATAGRLERELTLRVTAAIATLEARLAETRLEFEDINRHINERLLSLHDGEDGEPGRDGRDGEPGVPGLPGERGAPGPAGKLPLARQWSPAGVTYENEVRVFDGSLWQAVRDTGTAPGSDDWLCLAARGADATEVEPRGLFDAHADYRKLAIVLLDGNAFLAKRDAPGPCPGDGWMLLAARGKPGKPGEPGKRGEPGARGEPGPGIVAWRDNVAAYTATPVYSDGSEGPPLNVRAYLEQFLIETREG